MTRDQTYIIEKYCFIIRKCNFAKAFILLPILISSFLLTSCVDRYYTPTMQNVPLFIEKNEYRVSASAGSNEDLSTETLDINTAYSITNKFATMLNYSGARFKPSLYPRSKSHSIDAAFGYYNAIDENSVFEVYSGFGCNSQEHIYGFDINNNIMKADLTYTKIFIQPSIGVTSHLIDVVFSASLNRISFQKINNQMPIIYKKNNIVEVISKNRNSYLIEPAITIRCGWKYVKLQIQVLYSKNLSHDNLRFNEIKGSAGLSFAFAQRFF